VTASPTVGVLALQGDVREHVVALERAGTTARPVRREAELEGLAGIVLPGGESTTMDKLYRALVLLDPRGDREHSGVTADG
jgi:5'-phosphate synthase pdxT subunit